MYVRASKKNRTQSHINAHTHYVLCIIIVIIAIFFFIIIIIIIGCLCILLATSTYSRRAVPIHVFMEEMRAAYIISSHFRTTSYSTVSLSARKVLFLILKRICIQWTHEEHVRPLFFIQRIRLNVTFAKVQSVKDRYSAVRVGTVNIQVHARFLRIAPSFRALCSVYIYWTAIYRTIREGSHHSE